MVYANSANDYLKSQHTNKKAAVSITQKPKCTIFNHKIINKKPCKPIDSQGFKNPCL
ncbi:hypothetical protein GNIT_0463 [Glaciecola nitratireducens FR1064]|uniref:Uncharacterized protein n=1 Tax=Glaciecola nitratireducens (strain JCM 12485 / KCTC 12276 / FR1064) TaxID=1085623 RepID=G4QFJ2_GLANF|nr:hypothetical protein GNIT_0463 [Glaciecola nitratireducens FR1064]